MTNLGLAKLLRNIAAVYQIFDVNRFRIIAYERAADSIEHLTSEVKDVWDDGKLNGIPGIGPTIAQHLDELFKTGKVKHFDQILKKVPESVFPLLSIPGIGPKKAYKLVHTLKLANARTIFDDLKKAVRKHQISPIEGFGDISEKAILDALLLFQKRKFQQKRIPLSEADILASAIVEYLKNNSYVSQCDVLGSLRRKVATVGDIDIAVATDHPSGVIAYFCDYPHEKIIEKGPTGASLLLTNGRQVDIRVQDKRSYGAMLQYFTGSKNHNIHLREFALKKGLSLSEYGIKPVGTIQTSKVKSQYYNRKHNLFEFPKEDALYQFLGIPWIPPELREDKGEIDAAISHSLPHLIETSDMKGDLHIHTDFDIESSHDIGQSDITQYLDRAYNLGYDYIGIADHNPSQSHHTQIQIVSIMKRRKEYYEQKYYSWQKNKNKRVHMVLMIEVDILSDGTLALPEKAFEYVDAIIVSVHSSFQMDRTDMTRRIISACNAHPKVKIFGHPTGRILEKREGYEIDWDQVFSICREKHIALEINAYPYRLDLPDALVYDAVREHIPLVINTDSHQVNEMDMIAYGVSVARRGWCEKDDIVNTMSYDTIIRWIKMK